MFDYEAYSLRIRSALPLPGLIPSASAGAEPDISVRYGKLAPPEPEEMETFYFSRSDTDGLYYFVRDVGGLQAREGREIIIDPMQGLVAGGFHNLVSGIGMGLALHQRGVFTLHASGVAIDGGVAAFIGWKGMGKSTTAAAFYGAGRWVVTDDLLVLRVDDRGVSVLPGFPSVKLWPEAAAAALGDDPEMLPRLHPEAEKRARSVGDNFDLAPLPLRVIYVLDYAEGGEAPGIEPVPGSAAYVELVRHSFALRLLGEAGITPLHFRQCAEVTRRIPIRRLRRVRDLNGLQGIISQVEEDVASCTTAVAA